MEICGVNVTVYTPFGDGEGQYIPPLGMEKGGVTLSVLHLTSVSQMNRNLRQECRRIFIIHCILVTRMSHQWKSAAQMSQNFHHILYISDCNVTPMEICGTNVTELSSYIVYK
jgi:hypothetical protein